jgi:hypothetical protein
MQNKFMRINADPNTDPAFTITMKVMQLTLHGQFRKPVNHFFSRAIRIPNKGCEKTEPGHNIPNLQHFIKS